jgi:hypothetical protein
MWAKIIVEYHQVKARPADIDHYSEISHNLHPQRNPDLVKSEPDPTPLPESGKSVTTDVAIYPQSPADCRSPRAWFANGALRVRRVGTATYPVSGDAWYRKASTRPK